MEAVNAAELGVNAWIDYDGFGGGFLSEFIAYHGTWYHDLHADENDPTWNIAGGSAVWTCPGSRSQLAWLIARNARPMAMIACHSRPAHRL